MYSIDTQIRVRYNETDRMGYLHHGCYPAYFEIARTEMLRSLGTTYKELEDSGIIMPVHELHILYKYPAFYDDLLIVSSQISFLPVVKLIIDYKIVNPPGILVCEATSTNVFVSVKTKKPTRAPADFLRRFEGLI